MIIPIGFHLATFYGGHRAHFAGVPAEEKDKMTSSNVVQLYGIALPAVAHA